jgi:hypothetical protein
MWLVKEDGDELEIKGVPVVRWCIAAGLLIAGIYYSPEIWAYLLSKGNFGASPGIFVFSVAALLFFPAAAVVTLYFSPLIITRFNKRSRVIFSKEFTVTGIHTRKIAFDHLDGGVRLETEEDEDGKAWFTPYYVLKNGDRIQLSAVASAWHSSTKEVGVKINEYLSVAETEETFAAPDDIIRLNLS